MEPPTDFDDWERQYEAELEMLREQGEEGNLRMICFGWSLRCCVLMRPEEEERSAKRVLFEPPVAAMASPKSPPKRQKKQSLREFDDDEDFLRDIDSPSKSKAARPFSDVDEEAKLEEDRACVPMRCALISLWVFKAMVLLSLYLCERLTHTHPASKRLCTTSACVLRLQVQSLLMRAGRCVQQK
jgi:hypothetical protein